MTITLSKKIIGYISGGVAALSIVAVISIKVFVYEYNKEPSNMSCDELQEKIDALGRPEFDRLPMDLKGVLMSGNLKCTLIGKNWTMIAGKLNSQEPARPIIGNERSILDDF